VSKEADYHATTSFPVQGQVKTGFAAESSLIDHHLLHVVALGEAAALAVDEVRYLRVLRRPRLTAARAMQVVFRC